MGVALTCGGGRAAFLAMNKPVEFRLRIAGFGVWRILYSPGRKKWELAYSVRVSGEQWVACGVFLVAEAASLAVVERTTGMPGWDGLRFALPSMELSHWETDAAEGVQSDAASWDDQ